ncbi:MAG: tetratricopeptide repeat protein [candidate division NC10 bacterium]|nr:tetratricopeptide repeat protein [candidate division NC10 bacterium]
MQPSCVNSVRRLLVPVALGILLTGCGGLDFPIQKGEDLALQGRWEEAVQVFREATKKDPRNIEARLGLARALWAASMEQVRLGEELEKSDRPEDAQTAYRRALGYNGENKLALVGLERIGRAGEIQDRLARARQRIAKKEWRAAQSEVQAILRLDPDNAPARALKPEIAAGLTPDSLAAKAEADPGKLAQMLFSTKPVTLRFRDTDIKEVLEMFSRTAGVNIFTDESLQPKKITTFFQNLPLRESFNLILVSNRLFAKRIAENTVIVVPDNPAKRQQYDELTVQTFFLTDADAKVTVNLLRTILNTRQIFVNEKLNALVIRETPEKLDLAQKLIEANDRSVGEVEIDLEVLEVNRAATQNLGIDFSPRSLQVQMNIPEKVTINNAWNEVRLGSTLSFPSGNPTLILNLVKNDSNTKVLANPTVRILDRQKARLLIGERRPFLISSISSSPAIATTTTTGTTTSSAATTTQSNVEYRDLGLKMTRTPTVHLDGEVTVELNFEISSLGAPIADVQSANLLPPVNTRNLDTFIKVRNGETRLLGGLFQETQSDANSRLPFLSEIPLLGRMFVNPAYNRNRTDILISLTPRIVKALDRPEPATESFASGTAESFGPAAGPAAPVIPGPTAPQRPAAPGQPAIPTPGGGVGGSGGSAPGPRP